MFIEVRTLHVLPCVGEEFGGPTKSVPALCGALLKVGVITRLLSQAKAPAEYAEKFKVPVDLFRPLAFTEQFPSPSFLWRMCVHIRKAQIVNIHALWSPVSTIAAFFCRKLHVPYVVFPLGMLRTEAMRRSRVKKRMYYWLFERHTINGAAAIAVFNEVEAYELPLLTTRNSRLISVPNGISWTELAQAKGGFVRSEIPAFMEKRIVLFLGRLHWSKDLSLQAEAFRIVAQSLPDVVWVLAGPDGGEWAKIASILEQADLADRVLHLGLLPRQDCLDLMADASVFVMTSRHEGHSMALNEALGLHLPIVITRRASFAALEDVPGIAIVDANPEDVAKAIIGLLTSAEGNRESVAASRRHIQHKFSWESSITPLLEFYQTVCASPISAADGAFPLDAEKSLAQPELERSERSAESEG